MNAGHGDLEWDLYIDLTPLRDQPQACNAMENPPGPSIKFFHFISAIHQLVAIHLGHRLLIS